MPVQYIMHFCIHLKTTKQKSCKMKLILGLGWMLDLFVILHKIPSQCKCNHKRKLTAYLRIHHKNSEGVYKLKMTMNGLM